MASIQAVDLVTRAGVLLQDATNVRWPTAELLNWLNDGQREIVLLKPVASVTNASVALTASVTKQTLPATGIMLLDVTRNMGADGLTPGDAIRVVSREVLDSQLPGWHALANADGKIKHFMFDPRDPRNFYVYPKAPASAWYVELIYSSSPNPSVLASVSVTFQDSGDTVTAASHGLAANTAVSFTSITTTTGISINTTYYVKSPATNTFQLSLTPSGSAIVLTTDGTGVMGNPFINIDDVYANALLDYVMYRAYSKDAEYAQNAALAVAHYNAFQSSLGVRTQNEMTQNPNLSVGAFNPNVPGAARQ